MMRNLLLFVFFFGLVQLKAQNYPMNAANHNQTIVTCSGTFTDDGGAGGNYSNNISDRIITFCTANPGELLRFDFSSFHTETNFDVLEVFNGPTATGQPAQTYTGNLGALVFISNQPGGCVTFRFNSDFSQTYSGWVAQISCVEPCVAPTAVLADTSTEEICSSSALNPGDLTLSFNASGSFSNDGFNVTTYEWNWGDGTSSTTSTPITTHTFPDDPGIYTVTLKVRTNNTGTDPLGCLSSNTAVKLVMVLPPPNFEGSTESPIEITCGDSVELIGIAGSQIITQEPPPNVGTDIELPDGSGVSYYSYIDLTGFFPAGETLTASCFPQIMLDWEHSYAGDLEVDLIAPTGQTVRLFDGYNQSSIGNHKFGWCINEADNGQPGCVAPYYIANSGGINWGAAAGYTTNTQTCDVFNPTNGQCFESFSNGIFLQEATFNSSQSMNALVGAELNGVWVLKITDNLALDDGFISSWSISFPGDCYSDLETETPILDGGLWTHTGTGPAVPVSQTVTDEPILPTGVDPCPGDADCTGNQLSNTITVGPFTEEGTFIYEFNVRDEFGCEFTKEFEVIVAGITTEFDAIEDEYCLDATPDVLPTTSANGIEGSWSPATIDTSVLGGPTIYTFTPDADQCASEYSISVMVVELIEPLFGDITDTYCIGQTPELLPSGSNNPFTGSWSPAIIDTSSIGTTTYTFTPDAEQCADIFTIDIEVVPLIETSFDFETEFCRDSTPDPLPTSSIDGYIGSWSPAVIDTSTVGIFPYTFTPDDVCVDAVQINIEILEKEIPLFDEIDPICQNTVAPTLNTISDNGIEGTWLPAVIDTSTPGVYQFEFTPDAEFCAENQTMEVTIVEEQIVLIDLPNSYCQGEEAGILPTTLNGVEGAWIPAVIDTDNAGIETYTFYPDAGQCALDTPFTIEVFAQPVLNNLTVQEICDDDFDGLYETNLTTLNPELGGGAGISYIYYASLTDMNNDNPIPSNQWNNYTFTSLPTTIYIVGESGEGCRSVGTPVQFEARDIVAHNVGPFGPIEYCPENTVDLTQFEGNINGSSGVIFSYYSSISNAQNESGEILNTAEFSPEQNQNSVFVRLDLGGYCPAIVEILLQRLPTPSLEVSESSVLLCEGDSFDASASSDDPNATFEWTFEDGTVYSGALQTLNQIGTYTIVAYSEDGCVSEERTLTVSLPALPVITGVEMGSNSVTVSASNNGEGELEYSLDGVLWQNSPQFNNLIPGETYTIWVRSKGCMIDKYDVTILNVPNFFSPNNDGKNDTWEIRGIETTSGATLKIFDRYGKIFVDRSFGGNYQWDGKYLGNSVPSGDYWYIIQIPSDGIIKDQKFVGHISVRNQ